MEAGAFLWLKCLTEVHESTHFTLIQDAGGLRSKSERKQKKRQLGGFEAESISLILCVTSPKHTRLQSERRREPRAVGLNWCDGCSSRGQTPGDCVWTMSLCLDNINKCLKTELKKSFTLVQLFKRQRLMWQKLSEVYWSCRVRGISAALCQRRRSLHIYSAHQLF